jgi:hypothetical protein
VSDFDVSQIVPSMRDLSNAIATRRMSLALVPRVDGDDVAHEVGRLDQLGVGAVAIAEVGEDLRTAARSTLETPTLSLSPAKSAEDCQRARFYGADGVCIEAVDEQAWTTLSQTVRSMRMMPLCIVRSGGALTQAEAWGVRAVLIHAPDAEVALKSAASASRTTVVVVAIADADGDALRALRGQVDAAVVPPSLHRAEGFASLLAELDS